MAAPHIPFDEVKRIARRLAMAARGLCDPACGVRLAGHVLAGVRFPPGAIVSGVWPLDGEMDVRPLMLALHGRGHRIALPVTPAKRAALTFRHWWPGAPLIREAFGTWRSDGVVLVPDILMVPLLAFDAAGHRLGYGGGYYDRTLATLPGRRAIGFGFAAQQVDSLPVGPYDARLPVIATEAGLIHC